MKTLLCIKVDNGPCSQNQMYYTSLCLMSLEQTLPCIHICFFVGTKNIIKSTTNRDPSSTGKNATSLHNRVKMCSRQPSNHLAGVRWLYFYATRPFPLLWRKEKTNQPSINQDIQYMTWAGIPLWFFWVHICLTMENLMAPLVPECF